MKNRTAAKANIKRRWETDETYRQKRTKSQEKSSDSGGEQTANTDGRNKQTEHRKQEAH